MGSIPSDGTIFCALLLLCALCFSCVAQETGEVKIAESDPPAVKAFKSGLLMLKEIENTKTAERAETYRAALTRFDGALKEKPDFYPAHLTAAYCVTQLAELTSDPAVHRSLVADAISRYEAASKLPAADARLYGGWAALLISESGRTSETSRRRELLHQAMQLLNTGLQSTDSKGERARLQYQFGRAELFQAQVTVERGARRTLYESALEHLQSAAEVDAIAKLPQLYASWGIVLLELGRIRNDHMLMRQAIERLQTALERDAQNQTVRYNLVCAYALLDQTDRAMRHLKTCLENDDANRTYFNAARQDPDLDSLRATPEFNAIFGDALRDRPVSPFERPVFSDK